METLDLNDQVSIKLTKWGASYLNSYNDEWNKSGIHSFKNNYNAGDIYKDSLWSIISTFKDAIRFDKEKPFNEMIKEKKMNNIFWYALDRDGWGVLSQYKPERGNKTWIVKGNSDYIEPTFTHYFPLTTWESEPIRIEIKQVE